MKLLKKSILIVTLMLWGADTLASVWLGPPLIAAGGLLGASKPVSYVDGNYLETFDSSPVSEGRARVNLVLIQGELDSLQSTVKFQQTVLPKGDIFTDPNQTAVPTQLTDIDFSASFNHKLVDGNDWGLLVGLGSDSNIPFNSIFEVDWQATGLYHYKVDALHSWLFLLNYSVNRSFLPGVPLPGAGYLTIDPVNHTQLFLGLPFFFSWQPTGDWNLSISYFILTTIDTEISRKLSEETRFHFNFQWTNELWLIANRADNQQHLIYDQKRIIGGIRSSFADNFFADLYGGFVFDQTLLLGHSITDKNMPNITLPAGFIGQLEVAYKF